MAIYTRGGDHGKTSLFDGARVDKYSLRVSTYGTFDELNANISVAEKLCHKVDNQKLLQRIEYRMFFLQGEIATENSQLFQQKSQIITNEDVAFLEKIIDQYLFELPPVNSFILPGSSLAGAQLHVCRTVCRRAERLFTQLSQKISFRPELEKYINRLSDFLYISARSEDQEALIDQVTDWVYQKYLNKGMP